MCSSDLRTFLSRLPPSHHVSNRRPLDRDCRQLAALHADSLALLAQPRRISPVIRRELDRRLRLRSPRQLALRPQPFGMATHARAHLQQPAGDGARRKLSDRSPRSPSAAKSNQQPDRRSDRNNPRGMTPPVTHRRGITVFVPTCKRSNVDIPGRNDERDGAPVSRVDRERRPCSGHLCRQHDKDRIHREQQRRCCGRGGSHHTACDGYFVIATL